MEKCIQSIQSLRDRYDSKTGTRTVAATLLCARYWECVLCQHSASHNKLHIMLRNCFFPEFWKLLGKKKSVFQGLFFFLEPLPIIRSYTKINEVSLGRYLRGGTIWLSSVGKSDPKAEDVRTSMNSIHQHRDSSPDMLCQPTLLSRPWLQLNPKLSLEMQRGDTINSQKDFREKLSHQEA